MKHVASTIHLQSGWAHAYWSFSLPLPRAWLTWIGMPTLKLHVSCSCWITTEKASQVHLGEMGIVLIGMGTAIKFGALLRVVV